MRSLRERIAAHLLAAADRRAAARSTLRYRIGVGVVGGLVVAFGIVTIPLPGPGWLTVIAGPLRAGHRVRLGRAAARVHPAARERWTDWVGDAAGLGARAPRGWLTAAFVYGVLVVRCTSPECPAGCRGGSRSGGERLAQSHALSTRRRAIGSVVERFVHTEEVTGSNPVSPTGTTHPRSAPTRMPTGGVVVPERRPTVGPWQTGGNRWRAGSSRSRSTRCGRSRARPSSAWGRRLGVGRRPDRRRRGRRRPPRARKGRAGDALGPPHRRRRGRRRRLTAALGRPVQVRAAAPDGAVAPVHLVSAQALARAAAGEVPEGCPPDDPRANLVLDLAGGADERSWVGRQVRIGDAVLEITRTPKHCLGSTPTSGTPARSPSGTPSCLTCGGGGGPSRKPGGAGRTAARRMRVPVHAGGCRDHGCPDASGAAALHRARDRRRPDPQDLELTAGAKQADGRFDFSRVLAPVAPMIRAADLAICHLETPVAPEGGLYRGSRTSPSSRRSSQRSRGPGTTSAPRRPTTPWTPAPPGWCAPSTTSTLPGSGTRAPYRTEAESRTPRILDVHGVKVAHIAAAYGLNGGGPPADRRWEVNIAAVPDVSGMLADAARARRAGAQVVIASLHCCVEYQHDPTAAQVAAVHARLASPDIDLVIGPVSGLSCRQYSGSWPRSAGGCRSCRSCRSSACCS